MNVSFETSLNVSTTPLASAAIDSTNGNSWNPSDSCSAWTERTPGRSRLLYWMTTAASSRVCPSSAMFSRRFWNDSRLCESIDHCESTTKTMPSAPFRTSLRVSL